MDSDGKVDRGALRWRAQLVEQIGTIYEQFGLVDWRLPVGQCPPPPDRAAGGDDVAGPGVGFNVSVAGVVAVAGGDGGHARRRTVTAGGRNSTSRNES